jgi:hypothetical protein
MTRKPLEQAPLQRWKGRQRPWFGNSVEGVRL